MKPNDTIFVAGHSGLLGSAFVRRFRKDGYKNLILMSHQELDLEDSSAVNHYIQIHKPSYIFLAAGVVGGILENLKRPADLIASNLAIQLNVFKAAHKFNVKKVIFYGSSCMYPKNAEQPMHENIIYSGYLEGSSQSYAVSKLAGLQLGLAFNQQYKYKKFMSLIPNSIFGPNDNFNTESGHVISSLIARFHMAKIQKTNSVTIWGTGTPKREFVYVDDVVDATLFLMSQDNLDFPINIGVNKDYSISELAKIIAKIVGYNGEINLDPSKPDGAQKKLLDVTKLSNFGWESSRNFEDDLNFTYQSYLDYIKTLK